MSSYPLSDLDGIYEYVEQENMEAYLIHLGVPPDKIQQMMTVHPLLTLMVDGKKITLKCICKDGNADKKFSSTLVLDEEVEEFFDEKNHFKSFAVFDGIDTVTVTSEKICQERKHLKRILKFNGTTLEVILSGVRPNGPLAKKIYKKIANNVS